MTDLEISSIDPLSKDDLQKSCEKFEIPDFYIVFKNFFKFFISYTWSPVCNSGETKIYFDKTTTYQNFLDHVASTCPEVNKKKITLFVLDEKKDKTSKKKKKSKIDDLNTTIDFKKTIVIA